MAAQAMIKATNRNQQRYRDVFIGAGVTVLLILIAELGARGYFWLEAWGKARCQACAELGQHEYGFNPTGYGDLMPDQDGIWTIWPHRPYHMQTNAAGLRNVDPLGEGEPKRILAIGDSFTFGPYVANEDTWPGWLQAILRQCLNDDGVEVLNAGIAGYTIEDELSYFRDKGQALAPDLVILAFASNDISDLRPYKRQKFRRPTLSTAQSGDGLNLMTDVGAMRRFLSDNIALYRLADRIKSKVLIAAARGQIAEQTGEQADAVPMAEEQEYRSRESVYAYYAQPDSSIYHIHYQQYETMLREFIETVGAADSQLVIVAFPMYWQVPTDAYPDYPQRFVQTIAEDTDTPYYDLLPAFRAAGEIDDLYLLFYDVGSERDTNNPFFPDLTLYQGNGHLSRFGYRVAARAIADFLFAEGVISEGGMCQAL